MQFKHVTLEFDGPVAILKLDHPEVITIPETGYLKGALLEAAD